MNQPLLTIDFVSIFPEVIERYLATSVIGKGAQRGLVQFHFHDLRDFTHDRHRVVDDRPYGGGPGMVLKVEPLVEAIRALRAKLPTAHGILTTPAGERLTPRLCQELVAKKHLLILCGRYEGVDERVRALGIDREISIGDYVLTGGELAAMVIADATVRFVPGFFQKVGVVEDESFATGRLEYPHYTRPAEFEGLKVPEVLLSGDHAAIEDWRRQQSVLKTQQQRAVDQPRIFVALVHGPVVNREGQEVTTSITNLDLHDMARLSATYGLNPTFIVNANPAQRAMASYIQNYWLTGVGAATHPDRSTAFRTLTLVDTVEECSLTIAKTRGRRPLTLATSARAGKDAISPGVSLARAQSEGRDILLLLGTGWGLSERLMSQECDGVVESIVPQGQDAYNHLSVRLAGAILVDRFWRRKGLL